MLNLFKKDKEIPKDITPGISQVKHIIAVASGKGGVGKSTVTTNLAVALAQHGYKVGLIDADIYGPSQPAMLGEHKAPKGINGSISPLEIHGVKFISMGVLNPKGGAVVMRAPLATKAITQFLVGVLWGELDFLLIDLPPGTGDIQLSLAQQARLSGSIIVTTPQKVAREISRKASSSKDKKSDTRAVKYSDLVELLEEAHELGVNLVKEKEQVMKNIQASETYDAKVQQSLTGELSTQSAELVANLEKLIVQQPDALAYAFERISPATRTTPDFFQPLQNETNEEANDEEDASEHEVNPWNFEDHLEVFFVPLLFDTSKSFE